MCGTMIKMTTMNEADVYCVKRQSCCGHLSYCILESIAKIIMQINQHIYEAMCAD